MQQQNVPGILEKIEEESFLAPTFISSGYGMVADIIGATEEVQTLLANKNTSLPYMRARYRERNASMPDEVRLVYFVVFGLAHDRQMVREISSYLRWCLDRPIEQLIWPWQAFLHGAHALELITGSQIRAPGTGGSAKQFDQFLIQVENWTKTHVKSSDQ